MDHTTKYDAARALNRLEADREAGTAPTWATDTAVFGPRLAPLANDDTVPMLPALVRRQAE